MRLKVFGGGGWMDNFCAHGKDINFCGCRADSGWLSTQAVLNNSFYVPIMYAYAIVPIER